MSFNPNILGAFVIGGLLTYIATNNSYFESEDSPQAIQYTPAPRAQVSPRNAQYAPQAIQYTPVPRAQVSPRNAQYAPQAIQSTPVPRAQVSPRNAQYAPQAIQSTPVPRAQVSPRNAQYAPQAIQSTSVPRAQVSPRNAQYAPQAIQSTSVPRAQVTPQNTQVASQNTQNTQVASQNTQNAKVPPQTRRVASQNIQNTQVTSRNIQNTQVTPQNTQVASQNTQNAKVPPQTRRVASQNIQNTQVTSRNIQNTQVTPQNRQVASQTRRVSSRNRGTVSIKDISSMTDTKTYLSKFIIKKLKNKDTEGIGYYMVNEKGDTFLWSLAHILSKTPQTPQQYYNQHLKNYKNEINSKKILGVLTGKKYRDNYELVKTNILKTIPLPDGLIILHTRKDAFWEVPWLTDVEFYKEPLNINTPFMVLDSLKMNIYYAGKGPLPKELVDAIKRQNAQNA